VSAAETIARQNIHAVMHAIGTEARRAQRRSPWRSLRRKRWLCAPQRWRCALPKW
jgi:hypothetical protein